MPYSSHATSSNRGCLVLLDRTAIGLAMMGLTVGSVGAADLAGLLDQNLTENHDIWRPYAFSAFSAQKPNPDVDIQSGRFVSKSPSRIPGVRLGFRTIPITFSRQPIQAHVYRLAATFDTENIERAGAYVILTDKNEKVVRQEEWLISQSELVNGFTGYFTDAPEAGPTEGACLIYFFHDGGGEFALRDVRIENVTDAVALKDGIAILEESNRSLPFPAQTGSLLAGERRWFTNPAGDHILTPRTVALSWEFGVGAAIPFYLESSTDSGNVTLVEGMDTAAPLPGLPKDYSVYLHYYGSYRYGNKTSDLISDSAELKAIHSAGITGIAFWDDYGLDYTAWKDDGNLDDDYLLQVTGLYSEAGFTSPMVYYVFAGLDRGRVAWKSSNAEEMREYCRALLPALKKAEAIVGEGNLIVVPVDEPDGFERAPAAKQLAAIWEEEIPFPTGVTCNWEFARTGKSFDHKWVGVGDYPSFQEARDAGVTGIYTGIDDNVPPLRFRYLAGVYAWATGLKSQGYWHFQSISGDPDNSLDDRKPDFICVDPEGRPSLPYIQIQEGVQDLRLLLALETSESLAAESFLASIRHTVTTGPTAPAEWSMPNQFEDLRHSGTELLTKLHQESAQEMENSGELAHQNTNQ